MIAAATARTLRRLKPWKRSHRFEIARRAADAGASPAPNTTRLRTFSWPAAPALMVSAGAPNYAEPSWRRMSAVAGYSAASTADEEEDIILALPCLREAEEDRWVRPGDGKQRNARLGLLKLWLKAFRFCQRCPVLPDEL